MNYFECDKCKMTYIYNGSHIPFKCGAFIGTRTTIKITPGGPEHFEVPEGCGGIIIEITKEEADRKVELLRN